MWCFPFLGQVSIKILSLLDFLIDHMHWIWFHKISWSPQTTVISHTRYISVRDSVLSFTCSSDGANGFCEASLPSRIAKARKREGEFSWVLRTWAPLAASSHPCCSFRASNTAYLGQAALPSWGRAVYAGPPDHAYASSEVRKCQHQPRLQKYLALISFTQADQNLQEQGFHLLSSVYQPWLWRTTCSISREHTHEFMPAQTHPRICSLPSSSAQPKALGDLSALKRQQDPQATLCPVLYHLSHKDLKPICWH